MRMKLITALLMAGTVVGCASNPPPPPPMAMAPAAPAPAPAPMAMGSADGMYKGMAELASDAPRRCAKMTRAQTVRVRNSAFTLMGMRAMIGPDGTISTTARRGGSLSGTASGSGLDMMAMKGTCNYHYTLTKG